MRCRAEPTSGSLLHDRCHTVWQERLMGIRVRVKNEWKEIYGAHALHRRLGGTQHRPRCLLRGLALRQDRVEHQPRSEEHTSELQSRQYLVCRLLLEKKKTHLKIE